jgi:phosphoribosylanthranilate isomerase
MFRVKICGMTRSGDVRFAGRAGADALGFQMSRGPRKLTPLQAKTLVRLVPPLVTPVGVFVDEALSRVKELIKLCGFQAVQLHGSEDALYCAKVPVPVLKAVRMKNAKSAGGYQAFPVAAFLLDSYNENLPGGTGKAFPFHWARQASFLLPGPVLLAGGLTPDNVQSAIRDSRAFGVDVASGVESRPGVKDFRKISLFIKRAQNAFVG